MLSVSKWGQMTAHCDLSVGHHRLHLGRPTAGDTAVAHFARVLMVFIDQTLDMRTTTTLSIASCRRLGSGLAVLLVVGLARLFEVAHMSDWSLSVVGLEDFLVHWAVGAAMVLGGALHALIVGEAVSRGRASAWRSTSWRLPSLTSALGSWLDAHFHCSNDLVELRL